MPPVDGLNLAPYLLGSASSSPRKQVLLGTGNTEVNGVVASEPNGSIWKRLEGEISTAGWTGPQCPNASFKTPGHGSCKPFCLFRLDTDPGEHHDLAAPPAPPPDPEGKPITGNCSASGFSKGVCLTNAQPILHILNSSDPGECCAACEALAACAAWNTNTKMNQCFLREVSSPAVVYLFGCCCLGMPPAKAA